LTVNKIGGLWIEASAHMPKCVRCTAATASAVSETGDIADQHLAGAERVWPFGQRVGGWMIHFPVVVCTRSPSTHTAYDPVGRGSSYLNP
jgi:hypothetical protein